MLYSKSDQNPSTGHGDSIKMLYFKINSVSPVVTMRTGSQSPKYKQQSLLYYVARLTKSINWLWS